MKKLAAVFWVMASCVIAAAELPGRGPKAPAAGRGGETTVTAPNWSFSQICRLIMARQDILPEKKHVVFVEIVSPTKLKVNTMGKNHAEERAKGTGSGCYVTIEFHGGEWKVTDVVPWEASWEA